MRSNVKWLMLLVITVFGCKSQTLKDDPANEALLMAWHSKGASAEERAQAANKWIPVGSDGELVRNLLGKPIPGWDHFHGPSLNADGKNGGSFDFWELIYPCSDNHSVALIFHSLRNSTNFHVLFDHATVCDVVTSH